MNQHHSHSHSHDDNEEHFHLDNTDIEERSEEEIEQLHFQKIIKAFQLYLPFTLEWIEMRRKQMLSLSSDHMKRIGGIKDLLNHYKLLVKSTHINASFLNLFLLPYGHIFHAENEIGNNNKNNNDNDENNNNFEKEGSNNNNDEEDKNNNKKISSLAFTIKNNNSQTLRKVLPMSSPDPTVVSLLDMDKVRTTIRQFVRDWAIEGKPERDRCYLPILDVLENKYPNLEERKDIRVLTPGAGLCRLTWEIAHLGFTSQGNEFSYFMLIPSNFILNQVSEVNQFKLHPYITNASNVVNKIDQLKEILVPDVLPSDLPPNTDFSMAAGDFLEIYQTKDSWDCIVTCFFLDTAHNIIEYIERIAHLLKKDGVWINNGPLLYHWSDMEGEQSIELSFDQIRSVILSYGFIIEEEREIISYYTSSSFSMMKTEYNCKFFVAIKN